MDEITHIYEAVDSTNDEIYHALGVWLNLDDAINEISKFKKDPTSLDEFGHSDEGSFSVCIYKRKIGFSELDTLVHRFEWGESYFVDDYVWECESKSFKQE